MDKDTCITNLRDLISPSNTDDENEALLFAIESVRARETVQGVVKTDKNGDIKNAWKDYSVNFWQCPECGYLLNKFCPQCYNNVILPKGGAE